MDDDKCKGISTTVALFGSGYQTKRGADYGASSLGRQTLIVIDECQILFDARSWGERKRKVWCTFFAQHRKYGYNIILITPYDRMIDRQIRATVEFEIKHRAVSNFKSFGFILGLFAGGKLFVAVKMWNGTKEKDSSQFFRLKRRYMRLYDSYRIFTNPEDGVAEPGPRTPDLG